MDFYKSYSKKSLGEGPERLRLGENTVEFLAFSKSALHTLLTPLVIVSGDFQHFGSYREFIPKLYKSRPVIIVNLPSYGGNRQRADNYTIEGMADLLKQFLDKLKLPAIDLMSFSLTGLITHEFALNYPEKINKLVVSGIMASPRPSFLLTLQESIAMMDENYENFTEAILLYLFNPKFLSDDESESSFRASIPLKKTGKPARRLLRQQIRQLDDKQKIQYKSNIKRALNYLTERRAAYENNRASDNKDRIDEFPGCPTLVLAGEFDHFVLPFEAKEYAASCGNANFVQIKNADHIIQTDNLETVLSIVDHFLKDKPMDNYTSVESDKLGDKEVFQGKRTSLRRSPKTSRAWLFSDGLRMKQVVSVKEINFSGGLIELPGNALKQATFANDLELQFAGFELKLKIAVFERGDKTACFLFKHTDIEKARLLILLLSNDDYFLRSELAENNQTRPRS